MLITPTRFVNLGYRHIACANNIWAVVRINTAQSRRIQKHAAKEGLYLDWSGNKKLKSLILLDNGYVIGSPFSVDAIFGRLKRVTEYEIINDVANSANVEEEEEEEYTSDEDWDDYDDYEDDDDEEYEDNTQDDEQDEDDGEDEE